MCLTRSPVTLCPLVAVLLLVGACTPRAYEGPARPDDRVAYLVPNAKESRIGTIITDVGGRRIDHSQGKIEILAGPAPLRLLVLPERLDITPDSGNLFAEERLIDNYERALPASLRFEAEAGRTYIFDGSYDPTTATATVRAVDRATGRVVAEAEAGRPAPGR